MVEASARIRAAESDDELEQLYELRARVFFGEDILKRNRTTRLTDDLDGCPSTLNLVVVQEESVVGGVRIILPDGDQLPAHTPYFDFRPMLPDGGRTASSGSMLCIHPDHRRSRFASLLTRAAMYISLSHGMTHLCASVRPATVRFFERLGWEVAAAEFDHPIELVPVRPMVIELARGPSEARLERGLAHVLTSREVRL